VTAVPICGAHGNHQQVRLRFCAGDFHQVAVAQPRRGGENRFGDGDVVIPGKLADHLERSVVDRRQTAAELSQRLRFYPLDQMPENVVENFDLQIGEPIGVGKKQIGHAPKHVDALVFRAALDRFLEFGDKRLPHAHGGAPLCGQRRWDHRYDVKRPLPYYQRRLKSRLSCSAGIPAFLFCTAASRRVKSERGVQARPLTYAASPAAR
jgi:hypothetical protein